MENLKQELAVYCDSIIDEKIKSHQHSANGIQGVLDKMNHLKNNLGSLQDEIIPLINQKAFELVQKYNIEYTDEVKSELFNEIVQPKLKAVINFG